MTTSTPASLPRPGVQVIEQFRATTPTVITPTLVPNVVGVCRQIVDLLVSDGTGGQVLNSEALIDLPASFFTAAATGSPPVYTGLDGESLYLGIDEAPDVQIAFSDPTGSGLTPVDIADQINTTFLQQNVSSAAASASTTKVQVSTVAKGEFESISIGASTNATVAAALGLGIGQTFYGVGGYNQYSLSIPEQAFPDPRSNLDELVIERDSVRVFLATGHSTDVKEATRTSSFLRRGDVMTSASLTSTADLTGLSYPVSGAVHETLVINVDGAAQDQTVTIAAAPTSKTDFIAKIQAGLSGATVALDATGKYAVITSLTTGASSSLVIRSSSTLTSILTFSSTSNRGVSIAAVSDGSSGAYTSILEFAGQNFTTSAGNAVLTASAAPSLPPAAGSTLILSDGGQPQVIVFTGSEVAVTGASASLQATIQAVVGTAAGGNISVTSSSGKLTLTNVKDGDESIITIVGGSALASLDPGGTPTLVAGAVVNGAPYPPVPGDQIWIDGVLYAYVNRVAPGGNTARLKINKQVPVSADVGSSFFIQAMNLTASSVGRPTPDLVLDLSDNLYIKANLLRDYIGHPVSVSVVPLYVSYQAVRLDTTALAKDPGLLRFNNTTELEAAIAPVTADNPLALGCFFSLINAPGIQVTALGVDEVDSEEPFGTVEAFTRAAEYLEGFNVYAIALLTHNESVAQVFNTHVQFMSEPTQRGERIVYWNPSVPQRGIDSIVASGTKGDGLTTTTFDTKITNLSVLLQNAGVSPIGVIPISTGLYLNLSWQGVAYSFSIKSVSGSVITVRTVSGDFPVGSNSDNFYSVLPIPLPVIQSTFSILTRGLPLVTAAGTPDRTAISVSMNTLGTSFGQRRFCMTAPDKCTATVNGVTQLLEGFYLNCATVGAIGQQAPQRSFTNFPLTGFTGVSWSYGGQYSESQLDVMAGGGTWIYIQDSEAGPVFCRMALTTDMTSIETRTDSVTKVVDFTAKFMRGMLKTFIGRFNIAQGFLDTLGTVVQGGFGYLVENGVLVGATSDNIIQDENNRDTVLVDSTLDVPIPCNYIKLTLLI